MPLSPEVQALLQRLGLLDPQETPQRGGVPRPRIPGAPGILPGGSPGGAAPSSRLLPGGGIGGAPSASRVAPRAPQAGRSSALAAGATPGARGAAGLPQIPGMAPRTPVGVSPLGAPPSAGPPASAPILSSPYAGAGLGTAPRQPVGIGPLTGGAPAPAPPPTARRNALTNDPRLADVGTPFGAGRSAASSPLPGLSAGQPGQAKKTGGVDEAMAEATALSAIADNPEENNPAFLHAATKSKNATPAKINAAAKAATVGATAKSKDAPAWSLPLIRMGLSMAASRNPQFGQAFAEGGLAGLNTYVSERDKKATAGAAAAKSKIAAYNAQSTRMMAEAQKTTAAREPGGKPGQLNDLISKGISMKEAIARVYPGKNNTEATTLLRDFQDAKLMSGGQLTFSEYLDNYAAIVKGLIDRRTAGAL